MGTEKTAGGQKNPAPEKSRPPVFFSLGVKELEPL
jgi:hypothetical protein